jgi:ribonuclease G
MLVCLRHNGNVRKVASEYCMSEEILINVTPIESRVALVENGVLQEVFVERERSRGIVGNIYWAKVLRVLPGMQAAFLDIGIEKAGYIHVNDVYRDSRASQKEGESDICSVLREGQSILVQVVKDPIGSKGARVSSFLSLSSRNLVYMPQSENIGVSIKIDDPEQRDQLRQKFSTVFESEQKKVEAGNAKPPKGGYIIRTAAESLQGEEFVADIRYLSRLWRALQRKIDVQSAPALIYEELQMCERVMRDSVYPELEKIRIDNKQAYAQLQSFAAEFIPEYTDKLELYELDRPIFDLYSIEEDILKALEKKVDLKSGGHLVIDQTEAMTTVDVNTGTFVGKRNQQETLFKTNLEATTALARQLRLRNLGGIIIVDFIDMESDEHRRQVLRALEKALEKDRVKTAFSSFSNLGLVEVTRKRTSESLEHILCESCTTCEGRGYLRSAETVCSEIFREIVREARAYDHDKLLVLASNAVIDRLLDEDSAAVADLQESLDKSIQFRVEPVYSQEQYDVVFL